MKIGALLIGFEYIKTNRWKSLPGIPVDLYQAYSYCSTITKNILVFTDIEKDHNTNILQKSIIEGHTDSGLLSFIEDIKFNRQYVLYEYIKKNNYITNNFDQTVSEFVNKFDKLIIYYTGHGKSGDIILPDNTHVGLSYLKSLIKTQQMLAIIDCCESNGMCLPYFYFNHYKLNTTDFSDNEIICLSSTHISQDSVATKSGSVFTRVLFSYLSTNNYITINDLVKIPGINIHTTFPNIKIVWGWVTGSKNNIDIDIDNTNSLITIKLNNCQSTVDQSSSMINYLRYHRQVKYN